MTAWVTFGAISTAAKPVSGTGATTLRGALLSFRPSRRCLSFLSRFLARRRRCLRRSARSWLSVMTSVS